jgi:transcriptional regulator with XRE-family HTH domain
MRKTIFTKRHRAIAERLGRARVAAGLTQVQVARKLRKPQSYVSRCESGDHRLDVVELFNFAQLYHKAIDYFVKPFH